MHMPATEATRKPIDSLTLSDLEVFPIWEFATDEEGVEGQDETWVRPVAGSEVPKEAVSLSVAADFIAPNGSRYAGIMEVTTAFAAPFPAASLIVNEQYLYIDGAPGSRERKRLARRLGGEESEIFPLTYTLRARVVGEAAVRTGQVV